MKIFCDFDDTLVNSKECIVQMINKKYGTSKDITDLKDWEYRSICKSVTKEDIHTMYEDDWLFNNIKIFDGAIDLLANHTVEFCTLGTPLNLRKKLLFLKNNYPSKFSMSSVQSKDKSCINMHGAVQIDDRASNLINTNAKIKILFKNFNNYYWQEIPTNSGIYIANSWDEIRDIIEFLEAFN